jgi:undecaprenyl-diphosphatase
VPFGLLLLFVQDKWPPLLRVDGAARDGLHGFAVGHRGFVAVMETLSTIGSWWVYLVLFAVIAGWLLWRGLPGVVSSNQTSRTPAMCTQVSSLP